MHDDDIAIKGLECLETLPAPLTPPGCDLRDVPFAEMRAALVKVAMHEFGIAQAEAEKLFDKTIGAPQ